MEGCGWDDESGVDISRVRRSLGTEVCS